METYGNYMKKLNWKYNYMKELNVKVYTKIIKLYVRINETKYKYTWKIIK